MKKNFTSLQKDIYFSKSFDKQNTLKCLEINFTYILPRFHVSAQVEILNTMLDNEKTIKRFAYIDNKILFFHVGEIINNEYICTFFCWNFFARKSDYYVYKNLVKKSLVTDLKKDYPKLKKLIIPVDRNRKRKQSYEHLLKKTFNNLTKQESFLQNYKNHDFYCVNI